MATTVRRTRTPKQQANQEQRLPDGSSVKAQIEQTIQNDPEAIARIKKSILSKPQGPTSRQSASFVNWEALAESLGQPFDAELVPFSKLRQMRRDPMIGFGLHYVKTPLVSAPWKIKCVDPQVAAFVDACLRPIYARLIFQYCLSLDFGFSAIVKNFKLDRPAGTYVDENGNEQGIWSEGNIDAVMWKPFTALPPEDVKPAWDPKTGEFNGIIFQGEQEDNPGGAGGLGAAALSSGANAGAGNEEKPNIDLYHALWTTNEKDSVFSSVWGYPRIAYSYRYWWSYWFRWALADRAFERQAVPPIVGYHPEGQYEDDDGARYDNMDVMLDALARIRSGGEVAMPSQAYESAEGKATGMREWEIAYLKGGDMAMDFDKTFNYLDVMKLRSVWVPEQAFVEGEGGTSSRNVAAQMSEVFTKSQTNLMLEIDDHINRYLIPQLLVINFPEFQGECVKVTTGFSSDDVDFMKQIIQLLGQADPASLADVSIREVLERVGVPMLSPAQRKEEEQRLLEAGSQPPVGEGVPGQEAGVEVNPNSVIGFSYTDPGDRIFLSSASAFGQRLPSSPHFESEDVRRAAVQMQALWARQYQGMYSDFARYVERLDQAELADDPMSTTEVAAAAAGGLITAQIARSVAERIVNGWRFSADVAAKLAAASVKTLGSVLAFAATTESSRAGYEAPATEQEREAWSNERVGHLMSMTDSTVRAEVMEIVAQELEKGTEAAGIAKRIREEFDGYPQWKADRVARTEVQTAYNAGTIMAARAVGAQQVQAHDASDGHDSSTDKECIDRHGQLFHLPDALRENEEEHPNGTLYFTIVPGGEAIRVEETAQANLADRMAFYDPDNSVVWLSDELDARRAGDYLVQLVASLRP